MVFPSIPPYFHDPANWQQHPDQSTGGDYIVGNNSQLLQPTPTPPPPPPPQLHGGGGGAGTIRPGSLADRARLANIPMPEAALKCPRCESTNTKFCYFNNYSLTQPRHFCKTCRRYWTRGGSMRNVPVGGGCRRNRRNSKGSSRSKSPVSCNSDKQMGTNSSSSSINTTSNAIGSSTADILGLTQQIPPSLGYMTGFNSTNLTEFPSNEIGLNYGLNNIGLISQQMGGSVGDLNFQLGTGFGGHGASGSYFSASGVENLRPPSQFPFLASLDSSLGGFESGIGIESSGYEVRPKPTTSGLTQQMASVKMEENQLNLSRQFLGMAGNEQYWSGTAGGATSTSTSTTAWTDLSGYSPFSGTTNPL